MTVGGGCRGGETSVCFSFKIEYMYLVHFLDSQCVLFIYLIYLFIFLFCFVYDTIYYFWVLNFHRSYISVFQLHLP